MENNLPALEVILAQPRGFCAGVERAIEIVERALTRYGSPIYVRHEIVHNRYVVEDLQKKGVIFVQELADIPAGGRTIFSAHGVSDAVEVEAISRNLPVIDATCPLVTKVHKEAQRSEAEGREIILIGHAGHPEVEGTSGRVNSEVLLVQTIDDVAHLKIKNPERLAYVTQTTLSVDDTRLIIEELKKYFPKIIGPDTRDICYATQNRQSAVKELALRVDMMLVIGSANSSNSNRLRDLSAEKGIDTYLINRAADVDLKWFAGKKKLGITAGASAPEILVEELLQYLRKFFAINVSNMDGKLEQIRFKLPEEVA
jgi:4-hydroxy-3-methylbut-2-enyl diphosphate reductase